ncbi:UNVERIFIED_CONTAM: hypothetical protein GTU68_012194 [Idotea baltica]|nr:hypothetical protein [Idotea baltica]
MLKYLSSRLLTFIPTFLGVTLISFAFIRVLPGDPIIVMAGERGLTEERYQELTEQFGFDRPVYVQFWDYFAGVLQGDLGNSFVTKRPVWDEFFALFPATLELAICAMAFAVMLGLPAGVIAAVNRGKFFDRALMSSALVGYSMPIFWWALLLIIVFSGNLGWTPVSGRIAVRHLILPTIVLGTIPLAVIARQTRSAMLEVLGEDYIRTARAKGMAPGRINGIHALRNALIPVITVIGLSVGTLLGGAILTETIFSWPGIGKWMLDSIFRRDYPVVQGGLLLIAVMVMIVNLTVDVLYGVINPKIRKR